MHSTLLCNAIDYVTHDAIDYVTFELIRYVTLEVTCEVIDTIHVDNNHIKF